MSARAAALLSTGLLALALWGCESGAEPRVSFDLIEWAPFAELALESGRIDFGTRAAREYLVEGWSWNETSQDGTTFTWGLGEESVIAFDVLKPRAVPIRWRCRPRPTAGEATSMEVSLNGEPIATVPLEPRWQESDVVLPEELMRPGRNLLAFRYRMAQPRTSTGDKRNVSVAWDWLRLAGFTGSPPELDAGASTLAITAGTRIDYFLDLEPGSRLAVERVDLDERSGLRLMVSLATDTSGEIELADLGESRNGLRVPLPESGVARLRLTALTDRHSREPVRAVVSGLAVLAPRREPAPAAPAAPDSPAVAAADPAAAAAAALDSPFAAVADPAAAAGGPRPDLLLYLVDTLRADRLGAYGNDSGLTPNLDAFAAEAVVFEHAVAQSSWTLPSVASLFTGVWPLTHGAWERESQIPSELPMLPELLREAGYRTAALVTNGWISSERGFDRGVELFERTTGGDCENDYRRTSEAAATWLDENGRGDGRPPFFLYVHSREPHAPYNAPDPLRSRFAPAVTELDIGTPDYLNSVKNGDFPPDPERLARQALLYDAEVACADWAFGQQVEVLRRLGAWDEMLVVFLGDHGEEFREHGSLTHGHSLYREMVGVPLMVRLPGGRHGGTRVERGGQQIDVLPTLLDYLGLTRPPHLRGVSLLDRIAAAESEGSGLAPPPIFSASRDDIASVVVDGWKAIALQQRLRSDSTQLYDLAADPWEQSDLSERLPIRTGYLLAMIRREMLTSSDVFSAEKIEIDPETEARLKALGYLN